MAYIGSDNVDSMIIGYYLIQSGDVQYIPEIMNEPFDGRETFMLDYKGKSVYEAKMNAMKRLSGENPPTEITYAPDTLIVNFYTNWAKGKGYLK